jgi:ACS family glucarate transporter-like MFS transporter
MSVPAQAQASRPVATRVRYVVLAFACALSMVTYLDRVAIASAAGALVADLKLQSVADMKWAFTAFALAYALFEVPSGWTGDVFGPRKALIRIVLWWSVFTALTAFAGLHVAGVTLGLGFLVVVRFLFGVGEAGAYPNITRALHNWLPLTERGLGQGTVWFCGKLMGGLTPMIWIVLVAGSASAPGLMNWRGAFWTFGLTGLVWCALFAWWFRNHPEEKPQVNAAELELIRGGGAERHEARSDVPWRTIVTNSDFLALCLMYGCQAYGWYFNITYLPQFLEEQYAVPKTTVLGAVYKGGPLLMGAIGCLIGGFVTDAVIRRTDNRRLGRRICGLVGHSVCVICFLVVPLAPSAFAFSLGVSLAAFFTDLTVASAWAICQDIGGRYAAIVGGFMNTTAGLSGAAAGWITGTILDSSLHEHAVRLGETVEHLSAQEKVVGLLHGYHVNFFSFAALYLVAFLCWLKIDSTRPLVGEEQ